MKVLFDHQAFSYQDYGGVSKYFVELIRNFNSVVDVEIVLKFSNNELLDNLEVETLPFFRNQSFVGKRYLMNILNKIESSQQIHKNNFDIFHATYFDPYFASLTSKPKIITVHDLTFDLYPEYFKKYDFAKRSNKIKCLKAADAIIAVSENTKKDIVELYQIPEKKIHVVYHGINILPTIPKSNFAGGLPEKYILFVGNRKGYKNFEFFIKSITSLLRREREINVVCIGSNPFTSDENLLFNSLEIETQIHHIRFSEERLSFLYRYALFFVFPSLYEGFGMPILEAFSNSCPVAISNTSCFPEIAGDAAIYFDPVKSDSILHVVSQLINNKELRADFKIKGNNRAKLFSWKIAANETIKVYNKII